ncbi:MAG: cupredoxin domain-containing protein [Solirubrobacterales bacterium]|nr:cupredoxin domain-containing protein [Solirubrobacterales bacterium]
MKLPTLLAVPAVLLAIAGCGSSSSSSSPSSSASASSSSAPSSAPSSAAPRAAGGATANVAMRNLAFVPKAIQAKVGQTVKWTNFDTAPHNVTYVSGPKFTSSSTLQTGGKFQLKLTQPGTIQYVCTIHPFMKASIVVSK